MTDDEEKREKDVIDKFYKFFNELSSMERSQLYDLLVATRGPDIDYSPLEVKMSTCLLLRSVLFGEEWLSGVLGPTYTRDEIEKLVGRHFRAHIAHADYVLRKLDRKPILKE